LRWNRNKISLGRFGTVFIDKVTEIKRTRDEKL
jgi:hypothetical protein